jgi:membrane associated rhomboid family serine protease
LLNQKPDLTYNCTMRTYRTVNLNALWFLIALNVAIFIIELITGTGTAAYSPLVSFLGMTPALLSQQPWTILTAIFVHYDFWHILFNMISLYFLGSFFLRAAGERSFLAVFFLGGLAGNLLFVLLAPFSIGIGASGAIFAIGGALAVMVPKVRVFIIPIPVPMPLWIAIIILFFLSFLFAGIAWQAHLGGLLLGLIAGLILKKRRQIYYL